MSDGLPVEEYIDEAGYTFQLNEADAKRLGYRKVDAKLVDAGDGENKAVTKPRGRRTATK